MEKPTTGFVKIVILFGKLVKSNSAMQISLKSCLNVNQFHEILCLLNILLVIGPSVKADVKMKKTKKALIVVTSHDELGTTGRKTGWYLPEVTHSYFQLKKSGIEVDFMSPKGGKPPMDENSPDLSDEYNQKFLSDKTLMARMDSTFSPDTVDVEGYDAIIYAGGHGTMWDFPENEKLSEVAATIYERGGVVAAICHGPAGLVNIRLSSGKYLVDGKKVATFTNSEEDEAGLIGEVPFLLESKLRDRGAMIQLAPNWNENVAVDERLVTGQNPASASKVGAEVVKLLSLTPAM